MDFFQHTNIKTTPYIRAEANYNSSRKLTWTPEADSKSKTITSQKKKEQKTFPINPLEFNPKGLEMEIHSGTKNGKIITWKYPGTKDVIFEWDENPNKPDGPHYHLVLPPDGKLHDGNHYYPGDRVPEPLNSIFFGG